MDGHFEPQNRLIAELRAEIARLRECAEEERQERSVLLERLAAAQATQHEMVQLLGRFLAAREREKAEWLAERERLLRGMEGPTRLEATDARLRARLEAVATDTRPKPRPALVSPVKTLAKPVEAPPRPATDEDPFGPEVLKLDHVERVPSRSKSRPAPAAAVEELPASSDDDEPSDDPPTLSDRLIRLWQQARGR